MDRKRLSILASLRIQPSTFDRAERLIARARNEHDEAPTFAACSVLLCAAGVAKMIADLLTFRAENEASDRNIPPGDTQFGILLGKGLAVQIKECPSVLSGGRYYIASSNSKYATLKRMVALRNSLMHIPDATFKLRGDDPSVTVTDDNLITLKIRLPRDSWQGVKIEEASRIHAAALEYWQVVDPDGNMQHGSLIYQVGHSGTA